MRTSLTSDSAIVNSSPTTSSGPPGPVPLVVAGQEIIIKPAVVGDVTWVKCHYDSIHGRIVSNWKLQGAGLTMEISVPANTTATVYVPAKDKAGVTESGVPAAKAEGVTFMRMENHSAVFAVGSGNYRFQSAVPAKESADRPPATGTTRPPPTACPPT